MNEFARGILDLAKSIAGIAVVVVLALAAILVIDNKDRIWPVVTERAADNSVVLLWVLILQQPGGIYADSNRNLSRPVTSGAATFATAAGCVDGATAMENMNEVLGDEGGFLTTRCVASQGSGETQAEVEALISYLKDGVGPAPSEETLHDKRKLLQMLQALPANP